MALFGHLGVGRHRSELSVLRGASYGLDLHYRFARHLTLDVGCEQYRAEDGTADLRLQSWRSTCGAVFGGGYRSRVFFVGAAAGVDALLSTHSLHWESETSRTWSFRALARVDVSVLYVYRNYRVGLKARVRMAREYVDSRFLFTLGYAFRSF